MGVTGFVMGNEYIWEKKENHFRRISSSLRATHSLFM